MRTRLITIAFAGLAAVAFANVQDGVKLRLQHTEKATSAYKVSIVGNQSIEVPTMGPMDIGFKGSYDWNISTKSINKEKNTAEWETKVTNFKFEMDGPMAMPEDPNMPKEIVGTLTIDDRYRVSAMQGNRTDMRMLMAMGASAGLSPFIELPDGNVKPGETWDVTVAKNPFLGNTEAKLKGTFKGEGKLEEKSGYLIELAGSLPVDVDLGKLLEEMAKQGNDPTGGMAAGMNMNMKGTMQVKMSAVLDKATGKVLASTSAMGTNMTMTLVDMNMSMPSKGTVTIKMIGQ